MSGNGKIKRSMSSKANRVRTAWFPIITDLEGVGKEMHIGWKYYDGSVGLFSDAPKVSKSRPPWGRVIDCTHDSLVNARGESGEYFMFKNRNFAKKAFKLSELNPALWGVNDFTTSIIAMRAAGKNKLLAIYLSLITKSELFANHEEGVIDVDGFSLLCKDDTVSILKSNGGSVDD